MWLALAYLLVAPPAFLLAPLTGLLACARPRSAREWIWVVVGGGALLYWLTRGGDIAEQSLRAFGVLSAGAFVALALLDRETPAGRALTAVALALGAFVVWCLALHVGWSDLRLAFAQGLESALREAADQARGAGADPGGVFTQMADAAPRWAPTMPGVAVLEAVAGMLLAWGLHRRIARVPLGPAAQPLARFRFSDQLVWLIVAGLALVLAPSGPGLRDLGANLLLVGGALHAARGLAVVRAAAGRLRASTIAAIGLAAVLLLPFVLGGLTLLGLADTWIDFRRRGATPAT
ncbi:MAG TPA: DUF2232 domain-containing protein [Gemmatimonadales bacterium]|nr:DUF2232 domain-containing protein [Gemmatimonadales bacterium]